MWPPAKTIAARTRPMASGATLSPDSTVVQMVKTRKKVPMNSVAYLRNALTSAESGRQDLEEAGRPETGYVLLADEDGRHHPDALLDQLVQQGRLLGGVLLQVLDALVGQEGLVLGAQRAAGGRVEDDVVHRNFPFSRRGRGSDRTGRRCGRAAAARPARAAPRRPSGRPGRRGRPRTGRCRRGR